MNLFEAELRADDDDSHDSDGSYTLSARFGSQRIPLSPELLDARPEVRDRSGARVVLGIRPESFADPDGVDRPGTARVQVQVELVERLGSEVYAHFTVDARPVQTEDTRDLLREGADLTDTALERRVGAETTSGVARLAPESRVTEGARADLVVDTRRLYFFDIETGLAIGGPEAGTRRGTAAPSADDRGDEQRRSAPDDEEEP
jgi:multiple sugar transport system ATP-binding protein